MTVVSRRLVYINNLLEYAVQWQGRKYAEWSKVKIREACLKILQPFEAALGAELCKKIKTNIDIITGMV